MIRRGVCGMVCYDEERGVWGWRVLRERGGDSGGFALGFL
jgi:hypothetical protein